MIKRILILPDVHMTTEISEQYKLVKKFMKKFKPDETVILGDFMDVSALSYWDMDKRKKMEGRRYIKEVDRANEELDYIQKYSKKTTYLCGNHEYRTERYIEKNPEMEGVIDIPIVLDLKKRKIKWVEYNEVYKLGHLNFIHGWFTNKYHARKHLDVMGDCIAYCHTHLPQTFAKNMAQHKEIMAYGLGCLCDMEPDYMRGKFANWINQFGICYVDTLNGNFSLYSVNIIDNEFMWQGKRWKL